MNIIARSKGEVGISAIDFFSFIHIDVGYLIFLAYYSGFYLFFGIPFNPYYFGLNFLAAMLWETIENFILYEIKLKYDHRRDSKINSFMDIFLFYLGGLIGIYTIFLKLPLFFINTLIVLSSTLIIADIYALIILKPKENKQASKS
ncbi:MAG: hypothetical protein ACFE9T_13960 [Promethearchaeota archaeon]